MSSADLDAADDEQHADAAEPQRSEHRRERGGTVLVNRSKIDDYDVDIGRANNGEAHINNTQPGEPGWLGNPYKLKEHGGKYKRERSVEKYKEDFLTRLREDPRFRREVEELRGSRLGCYCVPELCHGDIILEFLDEGELAVLRWENQLLREQVKSTDQAVRFLAGQIASSLDGAAFDLQKDPQAYTQNIKNIGERLDGIENKVSKHDSIIEETGSPGGDSNWAKTIKYAQDHAKHPEKMLPGNWVGLNRDDIRAATGLSKKRGQQLIDEWAEEKEGTEKRPYKRHTTSRKTNGSSIQRKLLKIDLDVWGEDDE